MVVVRVSKMLRDGVIGATSMQFPLLMASKGVQAIYDYVKHNKKPKNTPGLKFFNTGVELITDQPVKGLKSTNSQEGLKNAGANNNIE